MANRAYLYFTDDVSALTFEQHYKRADGSEREYMDSRHQFPFAWKLFFRSQDVKLVPNPDYDWEDVYLVREWTEAKQEFIRRVPLLLSWFPDRVSHSDIETFFGWLETLIANTDEKFLVVDPSELEIGDDQASHLRALLAALDEPSMSNDEKFEVVDCWSSSNYAWNSLDPLDPILGIYYGGYFEER